MIDARALWDLGGVLSGGDKGRREGYPATYSHKDADGTHWVIMQGSDEPVPATGLVTSEMGEGDSVRVSLDGGSVSILGNASSPSVGEIVARRVSEAAAKAMQGRLEATIKVGKDIADQAKRIAEAVGQHVWTADDGLHLTEATEEEFTETPQGRNMLLNAYGFLLREAETWLASFTEGATAFYDGLGNEAANIVAQFGADGAVIGRLGMNRVELTADGFSQYTDDGVTGIMAGLSSTNHTLDVIHLQNLRIGVAYWYKMYNSSASKHKSLRAEWPFLESTPTTGVSRFLLALRLDGFQDGAVVGNVTYAIAVPLARDYVFNVPGTTFYVRWNATNQELRVEKMTPDQQDSDGVYSTLRITYTGYGTVENVKSPVLLFGEHTSASAPGLYAVALGRESRSEGDNAFTAGIATAAASEAQTAIGKYNANDPDNAFEVGNGTSDTARSNAFAVGWDGTVTHDGDVPWTNLPLTSSVTAFSDGQTPMYRKCGPVVTLCGAVKMTSAQSADFVVQIGQLPVGCRPKRTLNVLCQGSNREVWLLDINESGVVRASRYRKGDTLVAVTTSTWFPFTATFLVA